MNAPTLTPIYVMAARKNRRTVDYWIARGDLPHVRTTYKALRRGGMSAHLARRSIRYLMVVRTVD